MKNSQTVLLGLIGLIALLFWLKASTINGNIKEVDRKTSLRWDQDVIQEDILDIKEHFNIPN